MTGRGWWLLVACAAGVASGVLGTLSVIEISDDDGPYSRTDPGVARWHCDGAEVIAVATLDEGAVVLRVSVSDELERSWRVLWPVYGGNSVLRAGKDGEYPSVRSETGDLDEGADRDVRLRPVGTEPWCEGSVSLT
jgi:hypothetical protein